MSDCTRLDALASALRRERLLVPSCRCALRGCAGDPLRIWCELHRGRCSVKTGTQASVMKV